MRKAWIAMSPSSIIAPTVAASTQSARDRSSPLRAWSTVSPSSNVEPRSPTAATGIGPMLDQADVSTVAHPPKGPSAGPQIAWPPVRRMASRYAEIPTPKSAAIEPKRYAVNA